MRAEEQRKADREAREQAEEDARLRAIQDDIDRRRAEKIAAQKAEADKAKTASRKAVTRLAEAGRLLAEGERVKALAIYLKVVDDYPDAVESDTARAKVRELAPKRKADPKYAARFDKVDPGRRQRDQARQLAEQKAENVRKAKQRQAGRDQAAPLPAGRRPPYNRPHVRTLHPPGHPRRPG